MDQQILLKEQRFKEDRMSVRHLHHPPRQNASRPMTSSRKVIFQLSFTLTTGVKDIKHLFIRADGSEPTIFYKAHRVRRKDIASRRCKPNSMHN